MKLTCGDRQNEAKRQEARGAKTEALLNNLSASAKEAEDADKDMRGNSEMARTLLDGISARCIGRVQ